ncbi:hypothetical protein C6503_05570 [Candidatus Poribacteria bacterium]|nr:MAG: hypothetical protein C6503_05570 [Candidatus Poribacteria bacterium]
MNVQDMTDAEVYELALDILFDKLGHAGLTQFLHHCKPCTGDYTAERQKWINDDTMDVKTIVKRVQERQELIAAENVSPKSVDDMSDIEIYEFGLKAISLKLGPIGIVRFVHLFDTDECTYALDQLKLPNANEHDLKRIKEPETEST